ncbi:MAG: penicillin-binding protein 2 [bacterium]
MAARLSRSARGQILVAVWLLLLLVLVVQLVNLQVVSHDYYVQVAEENRIRVTPRTAVRGRILDREGRLLASDRPSYTVSIVPSEVKDVEVLARQLAPLLDVKADEIIEKVRSRRFRRYEPVRIKRDVDFRTVCIIEEAAQLYPGVVQQLDYARQYYYGNLACHLLGYTGEVGEAERNSDYRLGSTIGRLGVERRYDRMLRGIDGVDYIEVSATGRILGPLQEKENRDPVPGMELVLSIDLDLQALADSLFGDTLSGAAVCLAPQTGEVLCLASLPNYDANFFSGRVAPADYQALLQNPGRPLFDRALAGTYPPGSTAKLLTAGAALQEGIITPQTRFAPCFGGYQFGNRYFRCHKPSGHGSLDLYGAIEQSCDTYFYQLGLRLGLTAWSKQARAAGFAMPTGIDLPGEKSGNVPDADWYDRTYGKRGWTKAVLLNLAIGQGELLVTPLSLAQFFAGIANHGVVMQPHLLRSWRAPDGRVHTYEQSVSFELPYSANVLDVLVESCVLVVEGDYGTARGSRIAGVKMGGKTGTAQNPHGNEHAWFVAFAPVDDPQIVAVVIVEQAGHGSTVAAPIAKKLIQRYLQKQSDAPRNLAAQEGQEAQHGQP